MLSTSSGLHGWLASSWIRPMESEACRKSGGSGSGRNGFFSLLSPSALLMRTVPVCGHSSPAPALTRQSPLLPRPGSKGMPLLLSPSILPYLVVPLTLTTFQSSSFIQVSSFELSGVNHVPCQDPERYSLYQWCPTSRI